MIPGSIGRKHKSDMSPVLEELEDLGTGQKNRKTLLWFPIGGRGLLETAVRVGLKDTLHSTKRFGRKNQELEKSSGALLRGALDAGEKN